MSTHTPGPWNCKSPHYTGLSAGIVRDAFNDPIADCRYSEIPIRDKKTPEQIDANARLIAAAPEMKNLLLYALHYIETPGDFTETERLEFCQDIDDLIAKAEGMR